MPQKILAVTDLHKRDVDFNSIQGFVKAVTQVQFDILDFIKQEGVDKVIVGGDWYDKGYRHTGPTLSDNELDRRLSEAVNGEVYLTLGNHYYLERDANPESYVIQPCKEHPLLNPIITPEKPIFKCVDELLVSGVQFSFFHFDKHNKKYVNQKREGVRFHVGVYHDDCVVPTNIRQSAGYFGETSSQYIQSIYSNVDLAIVNHIHVPIGVKKLSLLDGRELSMIIPGSLCVTQNKEIEKHKSVNLPLFIINDDGTFSVKFVTFYIHIDMLQFYNKAKSSNKTQEILTGVQFGEMDNAPKSRTLRDYMFSKGYDEKHMELVNRAVAGGLNVYTAYKILYPDKEEINVT